VTFVKKKISECIQFGCIFRSSTDSSTVKNVKQNMLQQYQYCPNIVQIMAIISQNY